MPYLVWSAVYMLLDLRAAHGLTPLEAASALGLSLLFGVKHLAFLNALFQFYLLFPLLRWLWNRADRRVLAVSGFLVGIAWLEGGARLLPQALPAPVYSSTAGFLPAWLPYGVLGAWAAEHPRRLGRLVPRPTGLWALSALLLTGSLAVLFGRTAETGAYAGAARLEVLAVTLIWLPFLLRYGSRSGGGVVASLSREFAAYTPAVFFAHLLPLGLAASVLPPAWGPWALLHLYVLSAVVGTGLLIRAFQHSPAALLAVGMLERPRPVRGARAGSEPEEEVRYRKAG